MAKKTVKKSTKKAKQATSLLIYWYTTEYSSYSDQLAVRFVYSLKEEREHLHAAYGEGLAIYPNPTFTDDRLFEDYATEVGVLFTLDLG